MPQTMTVIIPLISISTGALLIRHAAAASAIVLITAATQTTAQEVLTILVTHAQQVPSVVLIKVP